MRNNFYALFLVLFFPFLGLGQEEPELELIEEEVELGNYSSALEKVVDLLSRDSLNTMLWYEAGKLQRLSQKFGFASASFQKSYSLDTTNFKALLALANVNKLGGKNNTAINNYELLLQKEPENIAALLNLAALYKRTFKPSKAFVLYEKLHKLDSLNAEYIRKMARSKTSMGETLEAYDLLKKAHSIDATNLRVVYDLTKIQIESQLYDSAIVILNEVIKDFSTEGQLFARRGDAHYGKNHHYRSIPDYKKAMELDYISTKTKKRLGASLLAIERYSEARDILEQLIVRDTADYKVCVYLGNIYNELDKPGKGILFFDKATDIITPGPLVMSSIYRGKQFSYEKRGQFYKSIEMIQKRQKVLQGRYFSYYYLLEIADIYENEIKDKNKAIKFYEQFLVVVKDAKWYSEERKTAIETKINRLREDLHFEK